MPESTLHPTVRDNELGLSSFYQNYSDFIKGYDWLMFEKLGLSYSNLVSSSFMEGSIILGVVDLSAWY
jgi:hypothetical protein